MIQPSFNFGVPRSRRDDPLSSKRAAEHMDRSGTLRGQRKLALDLVKQFPGRSSKELAGLGTLDRYQLARRLPELVEMKYVRVTQRQSEDQRWWAV
jgi:hypothetical protein